MKQVELKGEILNQKMSIWREEVDELVRKRFNEINNCLLEQIGRFEQDIQSQHMTHINDISFLKKHGAGAMASSNESSYTVKQLVMKVAQIEGEVNQIATAQLEMARVLDQCNSLIFS